MPLRATCSFVASRPVLNGSLNPGLRLLPYRVLSRLAIEGRLGYYRCVGKMCAIVVAPWTTDCPTQRVHRAWTAHGGDGLVAGCGVQDRPSCGWRVRGGSSATCTTHNCITARNW